MYVEYFPKVYNFVYYKLLNRDQTDELVSEIFVKAVEKIDTFDESKGKFSTWVFTIARNSIIDSFRRRKDNLSIDGDEIDISDDFDMQASLIKSEERKKLHSLLAELTQRERSIITMKYFAEMTNREIAATLEMKESAVSMAAWRVRQRLREGLQEYGV